MIAAAPATRFQLVRPLGEGAAGAVYEALDRARGTRVAVKTFRSMTSEAHARLERELRSVRDVHHANLVTLGEIVREGDQTFLTMELVEGTGFLDYIRHRGRAAGEPQFDETRLRESFAQLAEGLTALHEAGLVHRDVKPSNVRVTSEGRAVLLDFGLVLDETTDSAWSVQAAGTPAYMAPEQALSGQVGPEADWYATGVLLFEALTGRVPFEGPPLQILTRKQKEEPPAPSSVAIGIPPDLDALCMALLRFDPKARPKDSHVLRALGSHARSARRNALQTQETPFVGRSAELQSLASAFRDLRDGAPVTLVVEGQSGIGKSALVQRFAQQLGLEEPEALFLSSRCYPGDALSFQGVAGIVESLADFLVGLDTARARVLVPAKPLPLVKMFPTLRRVEAIAELVRQPQPTSTVLVGMRARAFEGLRQLLASIGAQRPVVLAIHDAEWMDTDSRALLTDLLRPPDAPRLLLLLTTRTPVSALSGEVRQVRLGGLPAEDGRVLAAALLAQGEVTDPGAAERCARRAHGDPFVIDMTALHARCALSDGEGPVAVEEVVGRVFAALDAAPRAVLEMIAVAGAPLASQTISDAAALQPNQFARAFSMLRVMHLAQSTRVLGSECPTLHHERVGAAVVARLDGGRRRELHRRLAVALETSEARDLHAFATHWRGAGDHRQMAHYAALAGDEAVDSLAFERAGRCYELALSSSTLREEERRALLVKLGEARANAGLGRAASEAFAAAAEGATSERSLDLRRRAAEELLMVGDIEAGTRKLRDVAKRVGMWMPRSPGTTILALLAFRFVLWLRGMRFKLRDDESIPPEQLIRIWVCAGVARVLGGVDPTLGEYFKTRMLLFALRSGSAFGLSYALFYEGMFLAVRGIRTRQRVGELLAHADRFAQTAREPRLRTLAAFSRGFISVVHGRPDEAIPYLDQAVSLALDSSASDYSATRGIQVLSLSARAQAGDIKGLSSRLHNFLHEAIDRGDLTTSTAVRVAPALTREWLREGDSKRARAGIENAIGAWTQRAYHNYHHWACSGLAEVDLYDGLGRQAFERVSRDFSRARQALKFINEYFHVPARQLRGRSAILAAAQESRPRERARLLAAAARDARWLRGAPPDYAKAWAAVIEAGVSAIRGERERAIAALDEAVTGLGAAQDRLAAACARIRLGAYLGTNDERGRAFLAEGDAFMRDQGIFDPQRTAAAIVPGVDPT
jgi:hypothetical protein